VKWRGFRVPPPPTCDDPDDTPLVVPPIRDQLAFARVKAKEAEALTFRDVERIGEKATHGDTHAYGQAQPRFDLGVELRGLLDCFSLQKWQPAKQAISVHSPDGFVPRDASWVDPSSGKYLGLAVVHPQVRRLCACV
jgi:hypothetical protein